LRKFIKGFKYAFCGLGHAVKTQVNMRVHIAAMFYVIAFAFIQRLGAADVCIELVCCAIVIALEMVNTSLEALCDTVHPENHTGIKYCKDASAGAVLAAAIISAVVWIVMLILGNDGIYLKNTFEFFFSGPVPVMVLIITIILWMIFIFNKGWQKNDH